MERVKKTIAWEDYFAHGRAGWGLLGKDFELNAVQQRVLESSRWQPRVVDGDEWLLAEFIVPKLHELSVRQQRICVLINNRRAIIAHQGPLSEELRERLDMREFTSPTGVLAVVADVATDACTPILDEIDEVVDRLENIMIRHPKDEQLRDLFLYKKALLELRRVVLPTTAMLNALSDGRYPAVSKKYVPYLRDCYDYSWRTHELIDTMRDLLTSALDTYLSVVSNRLNDIMKRLTIVTTIFMPVSFLSGVGGMNFVQMPFRNDAAFAFLMGLFVVIPLGMVMYFRRKRWM